MQGIEAQALNIKPAEIRDPPVGDRRDESEQSENLRPVIQVRLFDLLPVNTFAFDACLARPHAGDHQEALLMCNPPERRRRVGEQQYQDEYPEGAKRSDDDELVSPGCETAVYISDPVT